MTFLAVWLEHGLKRNAIDSAFDRRHAPPCELRAGVLWQDEKGPVGVLALIGPRAGRLHCWGEEFRFETDRGFGLCHVWFLLTFRHGVGIAYRNGLSAAKAASAPSRDKLVVAMPKPRERIQPLMPKLANRNTTPERNNIESSAICGSAAAVDILSSPGWLAARTALNVIPSVTGRKATEAATAKNAAHAPARCSRAATSRVP